MNTPDIERMGLHGESLTRSLVKLVFVDDVHTTVKPEEPKDPPRTDLISLTDEANMGQSNSRVKAELSTILPTFRDKRWLALIPTRVAADRDPPMKLSFVDVT